jgi:NitT/TauT family transport system ATP-binding protein
VLLALRDVGKVWLIKRTGERVSALESITLDVAPGEFLILLGPSGCGKSTLLQLIAGLEAPSSGEIRFLSVTPGAAAARGASTARGASKGPPSGKLTSMVFQDYALFPWRTVMGNIVFGPEVRKVSRAVREDRAQRLIELVNLKGAEHRYPHELSGGMRQRVALARALANDPQIVLFDEPLAALDAQTRRVLQDELLRIWGETGKTFVYVTHSLQEAVLLGSRIVLMTAHPGRIKHVVDVPLARPRHLTGRAEAEMLDRLDAELTEEVKRAMAT